MLAARKRYLESCTPEHNALRSKGQPDPCRAVVRTRRSVKQAKVISAEREVLLYKQSVDAARMNMFAAQDRVRSLKGAGKDYKTAAQEARAARAAYLKLTGELESVRVSVDIGSEVNPVKAV